MQELAAWRGRRGVALLGLILALAAPAGAESKGPSAPVESLHTALLGVMRQADSLGFAGRYAALDPVVAEAYDLAFMASKSLGRHWKKLEPAQREQWLKLFRRLTVSTYADRFDGFSGERFELVSEEPSARGTSLVHTRIVPGEGEAVRLDYRVRPLGEGEHRIIDVYLNGTVSELALRRSDYASLLKRKGFQALLEAVEAKIAQAEAGTAEDSP